MGRRTSRWCAALLALWLLGLAGSVAAEESAEEAFERVVTTIKCDCGCSPQTVKECVCGRAAEMSREIAGMIQSGQTANQVIDHYVELNGPQIRIIPTAQGFNLVAWLGPLLGLVLASLALTWWIRRMRVVPEPQLAGAAVTPVAPPVDGGAAATAPEVASPDDDEDYRRRLARQLKEWD